MGCSVSLRSDKSEAPVTNVCQTELDCGFEGVCVNNACLARRGSIDDVLLEVVPDTSSGIADDSALKLLTLTSTSGLSFLIPQSGIATNDRERSVHVPAVAHVVGKVQTLREDAPSCAFWDNSNPGSIRARVTFRRVGMLDGVAVDDVRSLIAQVDTFARQAFEARLLASTYDVYVEPSCPSEEPPLLMTGLDVGSPVDLVKPPAVLTLPASRQLSGLITRSNGTLKDWTISLVDPRQGRRISTAQQLGSGSPTNFSLRYRPVVPMDGRDPGSPVIQIAPPSDLSSANSSTAPTMYWVLSASDLNGSGKVPLNADGLPTEEQLIEVSGQVRSPDQKGVMSRLFFFSTSLANSAGIIANSTVRTDTDEMGHYIIGLLPGDYRVVAVPEPSQKPTAGDAADAAVAATDTASRWAITERRPNFTGSVPQAFDISLDEKIALTGKVTLAPLDIPAAGASLVFTPTDPGRYGSLVNSLARTLVLPTAPSPIKLDATGEFQIALDPGRYDVTIRPEDGSNYGWWVYPGFEVGAQTERRLNATLPLPVAFDGQVLDGAKPVGQALVKVFAKTSSGTGATQVGVAHTDDRGRFRLRVPSSLAP